MLPKTKRGKIIVSSALLVAVLMLISLRVLHGRLADPVEYRSTVDRAIEERDPVLCEDVKATTRPGPTDQSIEIFGQEAVDWCKQQVEAGEKILGG